MPWGKDSTEAAEVDSAGRAAPTLVSGSLATVIVTVSLLAIYLLARPYAPDLSAQLARADVVKSAGYVWWWTGWFGGLSVPSYSVLVPALMAEIGVRLTAVLAVVGSAAASIPLMRHTVRPRAGAVALSVVSFADVLVGRVTFSVGFAFALWALVCIVNRRYIRAALLTTLAFLATPLAALFLGIVLVAMVLSDSSRRRGALTIAVLLAVLAGTAAILLPNPGQMTAAAWSMWPPVGGCIAVLLSRPPRIVRTATLLTMVAILLFLLFPMAVGANMDRLAWMAATPAVVAVGQLPSRRLIAALALGTLIWPAIDVAEQVRWPPSRSSTTAYYTSLVSELQRQQQAAGAGATGERLEVVDTIDHGASFVLSRTFSLARGWDRPADRANNALFYLQGSLDAVSYRAWLDHMAVGWVAVPNGQHDVAARAEAALIAQHLDYLTPVWSSPDWSLYRVKDAAPLATGATVVQVRASDIVLRAPAAGVVKLHVKWSPYLTTVDPSTGSEVPGCVTAAPDGLSEVVLPAAGDVAVTSRFSLGARFRDPNTCLQNLSRPQSR